MGRTDLVRMMEGLAAAPHAATKELRSKSLMEVVKLDHLYTEFLKLAPNGLLSTKRLEEALVIVDNLRIDNTGVRPYAWNFGGGPSERAAKTLSATMRKGLTILRIVKNNPCNRSLYIQGLCPASVAVIDKLVAAISVTPCRALPDIVEAMEAHQSMAIFDKVLAGELAPMPSDIHDGTPPPTSSCHEPPTPSMSLSNPGSGASAGAPSGTSDEAAVITDGAAVITLPLVFRTKIDMKVAAAQLKAEEEERIRASGGKRAKPPRNNAGYVGIERFKRNICRQPRDIKKVLVRSLAFRKVYRASRLDGFDSVDATTNAHWASKVAFYLLY